VLPDATSREVRLLFTFYSSLPHVSLVRHENGGGTNWLVDFENSDDILAAEQHLHERPFDPAVNPRPVPMLCRLVNGDTPADPRSIAAYNHAVYGTFSSAHHPTGPPPPQMQPTLGDASCTQAYAAHRVAHDSNTVVPPFDAQAHHLDRTWVTWIASNTTSGRQWRVHRLQIFATTNDARTSAMRATSRLSSPSSPR